MRSENRIQRTCPEQQPVDETAELQPHRPIDAAPESQYAVAGRRQARGCLQQGCGRQFRYLRGGKLQGLKHHVTALTITALIALYKRFRGQEPTIDALLERNEIKVQHKG